MSDWLTYTPETFLMFSERTYRRLFEMHNAALWPAHVATLVAGIVILVLIFRRGTDAGHTIAATLAIAWLTVAVAWFWHRFSTIHTGGRIIAAAFALEAIGLLWFGMVGRRVKSVPPAGITGWIPFVFLAQGLLLSPLLGRALGRPWAQSEVFGFAPDPTVIATIAALLLARRAPWFLWVIPVCWCLFSGLTLWAMHTPDAWLPPAIALACVALNLTRRRERAGDRLDPPDVLSSNS